MEKRNRPAQLHVPTTIPNISCESSLSLHMIYKQSSKFGPETRTMATARLLRSVRPLASVAASSSSSSSSSSSAAGFKTERCLSKTGLNHGESLVTAASKNGKRWQTVAVATPATVETAKTRVSELLPSLMANVIDAILDTVKIAARMKIRISQIQMLIEKTIIDCRFFTLLAVAGSLLGSILCYVEGSFIVAESYLQYFQSLSQESDQSHIVELLIEAIDMFLVGTALVVFGVGLYAMFVVGSKNRHFASNLFGLFDMKKLPSWVEMESVSAAKSKIGHAVMMILQVGVLEKFRTVPLISAPDLACFAGAVLISSASIFFLSRLNGDSTNAGGK